MGCDGSAGARGSQGSVGAAGPAGRDGLDGCLGRDGSDGDPWQRWRSSDGRFRSAESVEFGGFFARGSRGDVGAEETDGSDGARGSRGFVGAEENDVFEEGQLEEMASMAPATRRRRLGLLPQTPQVLGGECGAQPSSPIVGLAPPEDRLTPGFPIRDRVYHMLPRAPQVPGGVSGPAPASPPPPPPPPPPIGVDAASRWHRRMRRG